VLASRSPWLATGQFSFASLSAFTLLFALTSGALIFLGSVAALLALSGTYEELYSLFVFAGWIFFALTAITLFRLRRSEPNLSRPYRAWGHPLDDASLFGCRRGSDRQLVDGPAGALVDGPGSHPGWHPLLLLLAKAGQELHGSQRIERLSYQSAEG